ncbi:MAG: respiratory nitrate reductase subunit gamma [Pseudomonadales bacterium]|nr:respiratory nitrate reductase subunit gamma [Pseudomonadales bacterium]
MSFINELLFGIYPYIAVTVMLVGGLIRFDRDQYSWKAGSSQMLSDKGMRIGSNFFHIGIIFILAGHVVGLLTPHEVYHHFISTQNKNLVAMITGGFFGIMCFIGITILVIRRFTDDRVKASSSFGDNAILLMLYAQLILGLSTIVASTQHLDGSVMIQVANWAQSIVTFQPMKAAAAIEHVGIVYKLHVFLGLSILFSVPFTRLVHVISAPIWYLGRTYQIVRQK